MRIVETAWLAQPHPDLADAYAHVKLGDAARQRLLRVEALAAKAPGHLESALAIARAAIDTTEYARAREVLEPFIAAPTQRVAMLMAEIERTEHGDTGKARAWTLRAVRALHDPAWTADGYVSATWRPVSPVTGRLDAFQWQTPVAALPSDKSAAIEPTLFEEELPAPRHKLPARLPAESSVKPETDPGEPASIEPIAASRAGRFCVGDGGPNRCRRQGLRRNLLPTKRPRRCPCSARGKTFPTATLPKPRGQAFRR